MIQKFNAIGLVICFLLAIGVLLKLFGTKRYKYIEALENHIQWQDSLINQLRVDKDSLKVTRAEFDEVVKLLESKK